MALLYAQQRNVAEHVGGFQRFVLWAGFGNENISDAVIY